MVPASLAAQVQVSQNGLCDLLYITCCRHIVLAVRHPGTGLWGAIGLSRRAELMDKPLKFASLADLMADYVASYGCWWHTVLRIRIGLPVPHDAMYEGMVSGWNMRVLVFNERTRELSCCDISSQTISACELDCRPSDQHVVSMFMAVIPRCFVLLQV